MCCQDLHICQERQEAEIEALISIYSQSSVSILRPPIDNDSYKLRRISISIQIDLAHPVNVQCFSSTNVLEIKNSHHLFTPFRNPSCANQPDLVQLRYLPPFKLIAILPSTYPLRVPPKLELDCDWATFEDQSRASKSINTMWRYGVPASDQSIEGDECIGLCVDWLEHDWIEPNSHHNLSICLQGDSIEDKQAALERFVNHDKILRREYFLNQDFICGICLEAQRGTKCIQLACCGHIFCRNCLGEYFSLMIKEGTINKVQCCHDECMKRNGTNGNLTPNIPQNEFEKATITPEELDLLVGPILKSRYAELKDKILIESDPRLCFCPIKSCQSLVRPSKFFITHRSETLRICESCGYSFCFICKKTWHGPTNQCAIPYLESLIRNCLDGTDLMRKEIEKKYGQTRLQQLVKDFFEERSSQNWKKNNTTSCVKCGIPVEKSEGCNHMLCPRCQTHFCFRCGSKLNPDEPYGHYSSPQSPCFNQLINHDQNHSDQNAKDDEVYDKYEELARMFLLKL